MHVISLKHSHDFEGLPGRQFSTDAIPDGVIEAGARCRCCGTTCAKSTDLYNRRLMTGAVFDYRAISTIDIPCE